MTNIGYERNKQRLDV